MLFQLIDHNGGLNITPDKVDFTGFIDQILGQVDLPIIIVTQSFDDCQDIARMNSLKLAVGFAVPPIEQVFVACPVKSDALLLAYALKDEFKIVFIWGKYTHLHLNAPEERFVSQAIRVQVGAENDQRSEWDFDRLTGAQAQEIHSIFQWHDPAVEQVHRACLLPAEIVNDKYASIGF